MTRVIKTSTVAPVVVTAFHKDVYSIAQRGHKAGQTMAASMQALVRGQYGEPKGASVTSKDGTTSAQLTGSTGPTFEQFKADMRALKQLAKDRKLASDQWLRKTFCAALHSLYGKLPEATTPDAIRKQEERKIAAAAVEAARALRAAAAAPVGAPKGETQDHGATEAEQIDSLVTRIGLLKTAEALVRILKADKRTQAQGVHIERMIAKVAQTLSTAAA